MEINKQSKQDSGPLADQKNGIVTVNDGNNPTPEQRDELIGNEPDTERLRSERESVEEARRNQG